MSSLLQIFIVLVLLAAMILVLLGIGQLTKQHSFDDSEETSNLKNELSESDEVVSHNSVFHKLIEEKIESTKKSSDYKNSSKEPSSRKL